MNGFHMPQVPPSLPRKAFYVVAKIILKAYFFVFCGLKVKGKENLANISSGAVLIGNHVHTLDCAMIACQCKGHRVYFPTLPENLKRPVAGKLAEWLGAFSIPDSAKTSRCFVKFTMSLLQKGYHVHFFPEAALDSYCEVLRPFQSGAFWFAYQCKTCVIPIVITFRQNHGIRRLIRRKPLINLQILPPKFPNTDKSCKIESALMQQENYRLMEYTIKQAHAKKKQALTRCEQNSYNKADEKGKSNAKDELQTENASHKHGSMV